MGGEELGARTVHGLWNFAGLVRKCQELRISFSFDYDTGLRRNFDERESHLEEEKRGFTIMIGSYSPQDEKGDEKVFTNWEDAIAMGWQIIRQEFSGK